jgi:glycosyltransferase involved in cell wall biosynthesis
LTKSLFISYDGLTDMLGQSQIIPYLIGLSKKGFEIHILSCEKREVFENKNELISEFLTENNVHWHPIFYHKSPPVLSTLFDIIKLKNLTRKLHKQHQFKIIHCRSYLAALIGLWMKEKYGTKFIFDMRGFWADERVDGKLWNLSNPIYKWVYNYFKRKEKEFLQKSDYVVSLTKNGKDVIASCELGYEVNVPIKVIPCCVDLSIFQGAKPKQSDNNFILSYIGSIGTWYMLEEMLDFFKILKIKVPNAKFLFVTMESEELILSKSRERNIDNSSIIIKSAERKEVPDYISQSDASIFFIKPVFSKKASSPTKQGEIMAMGVPVVCNNGVGDTSFVIRKYNSGVLVHNFNIYQYEKTVDKLLAMKFNSSEIKKGAKDFYSLDLGIAKYTKIYHYLGGE